MTIGLVIDSVAWCHEAVEATKLQAECVFRTTVQVTHHEIKKNRRPILRNRRTGNPFLGKSQRLRDAEHFLVSEMRRRALDSNIQQPLTGRLRGVFLFGFTKDDFYTKRGDEKLTLGDCTNLAEIVQDSLQKAGVIKNDAQLAPVYIDRILAPKTQVEIELWRDYER